MARRILYLIDDLTPGGAEYQLLETICWLDRRRYEPHVAVMYTPAGKAYDTLQVPKFSLSFRSFRHPVVLKNAWALVRYIRRHRINLVQTYFQDPFLLAALTKPLHRARLVGSFRDMGFWRSPGQTSKMRLAYPFYAGFVANSKAVRDHYVNVDGLDPSRIAVIYNGLDVERLRVDPLPPALPATPVIGIVANLNRPVKRVQDFVTAAALVHRQQPKVRFCVVGGGHLQPSLEDQARQQGLAEAIVFTGLLHRPVDQVRGWYLGVITSETEGFCNAILEYMACGLPVVATAAGGNVEIVEEGRHGFLFPVGDVEALSARMLALLNNRPLAQAMGQENARRVRDEFSWQQRIKDYQSCMDSIWSTA